MKINIIQIVYIVGNGRSWRWQDLDGTHNYEAAYGGGIFLLDVQRFGRAVLPGWWRGCVVRIEEAAVDEVVKVKGEGRSENILSM
jgi:hypothetical protein